MSPSLWGVKCIMWSQISRWIGNHSFGRAPASGTAASGWNVVWCVRNSVNAEGMVWHRWKLMGNESSYFFAMLVFVEGNIFHEGSDWNLTVKMFLKLTSPNVLQFAGILPVKRINLNESIDRWGKFCDICLKPSQTVKHRSIGLLCECLVWRQCLSRIFCFRPFRFRTIAGPQLNINKSFALSGVSRD